MIVPTAGAVASIDQQNWPVGNVSGGAYSIQGASFSGVRTYSVAQTFTAGATGNLTDAALNLWADCITTTDCENTVSVQVWSLNASGEPAGTLLATADFPESQLPAATTNGPARPFLVTFQTPAFVTAGVQYALLVTTAQLPNPPYLSPVYVAYSNGNTYSSGSAWLYQPSPQPGTTSSDPWVNQASTDLYFATSVSP
jgi:hypothetical protein